MSSKRACAWIYFCLFMLLLLTGRLMEIQLISSESFSKHEINLLAASVKQRSQEMIVDNGRGNFLDRDGKLLTHKRMPVIVLFPFLKKMDWDAEKVADIIGIQKSALLEAIQLAKEPFTYGDPNPVRLSQWQMDEINKLKIPGVFAVEKKYELEKVPAEQLIGLIRENPKEVHKRYPDKEVAPETLIGVSGMEASFDEFLLPEGKSKLVYHVDGDGAPLFGTSVRYVDPANPFYPVNIRTTLDSFLQTKSEFLVNLHGIKRGGLVLLDVTSNSVLAMVSRPYINQKNPFESAGVTNLMLKQQILGSVFKTVVAAAAIDHNLDNQERRFDCSRKINGQPDLKYQHGMLNFTDSFARSCNNTFGQLSKELMKINPDILSKYAEILGLIGPVGWKGSVYHTEEFEQLADEEAGRVFLEEKAKRDPNYVALSGIGQHEVRATPLAVANMMATIARGGKKEMVRVASKIQYKNGTTMVDFQKEILKGETLAPYTAMSLQKLLREVVTNEYGTGRWFQNLPLDVAGKSGTAETDLFSNGRQLHNKWFAGYFPYSNPRYALVVVNLAVDDQEGGVNKLFSDMVTMIADYEKTSKE